MMQQIEAQEIVFAAEARGYWIDRAGTVWQEGHSMWISFLRPDGKRLYIEDITPSDSIIVHKLVKSWEGWKSAGEPAVRGTSVLQTEATGANGPAEPQTMEEAFAQAPLPICLGGDFDTVQLPWNELGGMRITDAGSVYFIGLNGETISSVSGALGKRTFSSRYVLNDDGKYNHDELVRRWEARQKKSDFDILKERVPVPVECSWSIGKESGKGLCIYDCRNEFELAVPQSESDISYNVRMSEIMHRDGNIHDALIQAFRVLHEPQKAINQPPLHSVVRHDHPGHATHGSIGTVLEHHGDMCGVAWSFMLPSTVSLVSNEHLKPVLGGNGKKE